MKLRYIAQLDQMTIGIIATDGTVIMDLAPYADQPSKEN